MKTSLNDSFNICHKSQNDERMLNELRNTNKNRIYLASHTENVSLLLYFPQNYKKRKENYRCLYYIHSGDLIHGIALDRALLQITTNGKLKTVLAKGAAYESFPWSAFSGRNHSLGCALVL